MCPFMRQHACLSCLSQTSAWLAWVRCCCPAEKSTCPLLCQGLLCKGVTLPLLLQRPVTYKLDVSLTVTVSQGTDLAPAAPNTCPTRPLLYRWIHHASTFPAACPRRAWREPACCCHAGGATSRLWCTQSRCLPATELTAVPLRRRAQRRARR